MTNNIIFAIFYCSELTCEAWTILERPLKIQTQIERGDTVRYEMIHILTTAVLEAGRIASEALRAGVSSTVKENVPGGSHHSISTEADELSQNYLLGTLRKHYPKAKFLAEESCSGKDIITDETVELVKKGTVFVLDALDGTAGAYRHRWDWSVCGNVMQDGEYIGGVVFAPDARGGMTIVGERSVGILLKEGGDVSYRRVGISKCDDIKKSTVLFGVDVQKRAEFTEFAHVVANAVETAVTAGSCALGVATVAVGKAEAIVQPHQWPWDWSTAPSLIVPAGGKVQFYHYRNGQPVPLSEPDLPAYSRINRTDKGGLGFIAGNPALVDWLWQQLTNNWRVND